MILLEDSDTGGPSSITDRMEYLFAFGGGGGGGGGAGQKVSFLFLFLVLLKDIRMWG